MRSRDTETTVFVGNVPYSRKYVEKIFKTHTAKELLSVFTGLKSPHSIRSVARRLGIEIKMDPRRKYNPEANGGGKVTESICWQCANATDGSKCSWARDFTPVEGWDAIPKRIKFNEYITDSYIVRGCPKFKEG